MEKDGTAWYRADITERVLAQAPVVSACHVVGPPNMWHEQPGTADTHTARLLCVEPIVRDSAESLLRELVSKREKIERITYKPDAYDNKSVFDILDRARKLLEGK